ncbi:MAG: hypothetical protein WBD27_06910 [Pyrinomonadaceae bacterium]
MKFKVTKMAFITRKYVRANPDKIFLFGDNLLGRGYGGQAAAMRGEPNATGIPTKKLPTHQTDAFFTDAEFEQNKAAIDSAFGQLVGLNDGTEIVIPSAGLGTGLANLPEMAPKTFEYLERKLAALNEAI